MKNRILPSIRHFLESPQAITAWSAFVNPPGGSEIDFQGIARAELL